MSSSKIWMHAYEQTSSKAHSGYALSMRSTDTAELEGLWLVNGPKCLVQRHPDNSNNSPEVWWSSPFIVPSLLQHERLLWHHIVMSWSSAPFFWQENHCACALVPPRFVCKCAGIHVRIPYYYESSKPHRLFFNPLSMPVTYIKVIYMFNLCSWEYSIEKTYSESTTIAG